MKKIVFATLLLVGLTHLSEASVTIKVGTSGWGSASADSVNGMPWGFVVSSDGAGFGGAFLDTISAALEGFVLPTLGAAPAQPTQIGSTAYYFVRAQANTSSSGPPTFTNGFMNTVQFDLAGSVGTGDPLGLLWFSEGTTTAGSHFGFQVPQFSGSDMTVPNDGANITSGVGTTPGRGTLVIGVPEPSRMMLLGLGLVGVFFRRRR